MNSYTNISSPAKKLLIAMLAASLCLLCSCERPEPKYVLKTEVGDVAYNHYEYSNVNRRYIKVTKSSAERRKEINKRREIRDKARGKYKKKSRWDF